MVERHMLVVDTDVIIDFLRQRKKRHHVEPLFQRLADAQQPMGISIVTHTELCAGQSIWEQRRAQDELLTIVEGLHIIPVDMKISKEAGKLVAQYRIGIIDALIAATAIHYNYPLVTLNTKDFKAVKNLELYSKNT